MLQYARDEHCLAIGDGVDIDLDGIAQIAVDQNRRVARNHHCLADIGVELGLGFDDFHRPAAEDEARPHQHGVADAIGDRDRLIA